MMNLRRLLTLLLALVVAAGLWVLPPPPPPEEAARGPDRGIPENSYLQVRHRIRDLRGELLYEVAAERLDQYPGSETLIIGTPRLHWLDPAFGNSSASARRGEIRKTQVVLDESVELMLDPPGYSPVLMRSRSLTLDAEKEQAYSKQAVVLSQSHAVMRGIGLDYRLDGSGGRLRHDVRARQFPPFAAKPTQALLEIILEEVFSVAYAADISAEALDLSAEWMEWDAQKGTSVYHGNVRATQGDMTLLADRLTVHAEGDRVQALHAEGNARWSQVLGSGKSLRASAGSIHYQIPQRKATLKKGVELRVGATQVTGDEIIYLIDEERVETPTARKPSERVRIRLKTGSD